MDSFVGRDQVHAGVRERQMRRVPVAYFGPVAEPQVGRPSIASEVSTPATTQPAST